MSVCLAAKADGTRLKPMVVFKGGKQEVAKLKEEFQHHAIVATSANGWMNTELTKVWVDSSWSICIQLKAISLGFLRVSHGG